jgi:hypothetical protein
VSDRTGFQRGRWSAAALIVSAAVSVLAAATTLAADAPLFASPLHLTREVSDPISGTSTIDEYCYGNRIVSISGSRTAIADYAKAEVTVIDFEKGTYSITAYATLARAGNVARSAHTTRTGEASNQWRITPREATVVRGRAGDVVELDKQDRAVQLRVTRDRELTLSRDALDAIMGTGYPNTPDEGMRAAANALRADRAPSQAQAIPVGETYHLPLEYVRRVQVADEIVETRNVVTRVGRELPPAERMLIPPGAKLVESDAVLTLRALEELDGVSSH